MILKVYFYNGIVDTWESDTFNTYELRDKEIVVVLKNGNIVGMYHFNDIQKLILAEDVKK